MDYNINYRKKDNGIQVIVSYKDATGKWKQKSKQGFADTRDGKKKAKEAADKMLQKLKHDEISIEKELQGITFKELIALHTKHMELHLEKNTLVSYTTALKHFKDLNDMELDKIKTIHLQKCVDNMVKGGLKYSTVKTYLQKVNIFFKAAIAQYNIINDTPIKNIKFENNKEKNEKRVLDNYELNLLLKGITNKNYHLITLIASTCGLRIGEIIGLTWKNVDFENSTLKITKQWKLNEKGEFGFGELKSKNSYRDVPLPKKTKKELELFKATTPTNIDNRIFNYKNTTSIASNLHREYIRLNFDISIHELRHTYATNLIANGVKFKTAAQILGHSVEMTMKVYSHVTEDMLKEAQNIIENIF